MSLIETIQANYQLVQEHISAAAVSAGRDQKEIKLITVTKGRSIEVVQAAILAGAKDLGENYPEEGLEKIRAGSDDSGVQWHMIGHIQSRKARMVCEHFNIVHSLDSLKLARRLDRFSGELGRKMPVLLQFNVSGETTKFGWQAHIPENWSLLVPDISEIIDLPNIDVRGLMTIAPVVSVPDLARPHFRRLRRLRAYLEKQLPKTNWDELSMGMSADFKPAIQEGATMIRIGSAILEPTAATTRRED